MAYSGDMIVNLTTLDYSFELEDGVKLKRAFPADKSRILEFVGKHFSQNWVNETEYALMQNPPCCFIATREGELIGFACYDASAKGFFGPTGLSESERRHGMGRALLMRTLAAMREAGYGYAIIGWVGDAAGFYEKCASARYIEGGEPQNSVYSRFIFMK